MKIDESLHLLEEKRPIERFLLAQIILTQKTVPQTDRVPQSSCEGQECPGMDCTRLGCTVLESSKPVPNQCFQPLRKHSMLSWCLLYLR